MNANKVLQSLVLRRGYYSGPIVVPPRRRVPWPQKIGMGVFIISGIMAYPIWVVTHLLEYQGKDKNGNPLPAKEK